VLFTNLASAMVGIGMYPMLIAVPQLVQLPADTGHGIGSTLLMSGLVIVPGGVLSLFMPPLAARISDRWGPRMAMLAGAVIMAAAYAYILASRDSLLDVAVQTALLHAGLAFCFGAAPAMLSAHVPSKDLGQVNGVNNLVRSLGTATSSAISATVLAAVLIQGGPGAGRYPSDAAFTIVFALGLACCLVVPVLALLAGKRATAAR
jgi:MFS family permease